MNALHLLSFVLLLGTSAFESMAVLEDRVREFVKNDILSIDDPRKAAETLNGLLRNATSGLDFWIMALKEGKHPFWGNAIQFQHANRTFLVVPIKTEQVPENILYLMHPKIQRLTLDKYEAFRECVSHIEDVPMILAKILHNIAEPDNFYSYVEILSENGENTSPIEASFVNDTMVRSYIIAETGVNVAFCSNPTKHKLYDITVAISF
ncbi:hypothetical protein QR680_007757 [Steinernema hermaphroditum]|uniref:Uncharacterized protein n=1 Tax=Steinernema hermaphroditum TaxID=289476 RepID=A0AA39IGC7_9BILA|nr:hypothetical protein QR680_007757 [Steinernema hermaphroditum]